MKKIIERLLIFFIGIPAIIGIVIFLPYKHNLVLNLIVIFFSGIGAVEFSSMLEKKNIKIPKVESFILGALLPLAMTLIASFYLHYLIFLTIIVAGVFWALISGIFSRKTEIDGITNKMIGSFSLLVYPGFFMSWIILMSDWGEPAAILLFLLITFGNDSFAWLFGSLFGANNRGIVSVSPNKSIAGFIGGLIGSVLVAIGALIIFPDIFNIKAQDYTMSSYVYLYTPLVMAGIISIIGLCTGIAATLGDLAESAIKRSCDFKDSGNFMLGRGGVLDSIDSIAVAAPVFYFLFTLFYVVCK
jgi:phosphatidate cytidylyltransferase